VHRHKTGFAEFCTADRQHRGIKINIRKLEVPGFAEAQAGNAQQSEQAIICPWPVLAAGISARHLERGGQEALDVCL
jgi:tagatose-1,6-bisphosphate aldolase